MIIKRKLGRGILVGLLLAGTLMGQSPRALYPYSFGGLESMPVATSAELLNRLGYAGVVAESRGEEALGRLEEYLTWSAQTPDSFQVFSAFIAHRFDQFGLSDAGHRAAIDRLAGKEGDLWVWFKEPRREGGVTEAQVETFLRGILDYAVSKGVRVVLYPHHDEWFPTTEDTLRMVNKINHPMLGTAINLCHELRSNKGAELRETFEKAKPKLFAVIISGADVELNRTNLKTLNASTVQSLDESQYDLRPFVRLINESGYTGPVGFLNFKINGTPEDYLARTMARWKELCVEEGLFEPTGEPVYDAPDQVVWDAHSRSWFVSNLGGGISLARDGYGWIARLNEQGEVIHPRWAEHLDAPSGMVISGPFLYVVDRAGVYAFDLETANIRQFYPIADGKFLNDIAVGPEGELYVSDFSAQRIYRIDPANQQVELFIESEELDTPDGLWVAGHTLVVASWGPIIDPATFATSRKGTVLAVDLRTKQISPYLNTPVAVGNLEGIAQIGDALYITDWMAGTLLRVTQDGVEVVESGLRHPADPGYSKELGLLAVPEHGNNRVRFFAR